MTWFKVDDKLAFHPKAVAAGNSAMGLWIRAGAWSADQLTDGHIPKTIVTSLGGKPADTKRLIAAGLWIEEPNGYRMHDWHHYQPLREEAETVITGKRAGGQLGAHRRWHRDNPSPTCDYCNGITH